MIFEYFRKRRNNRVIFERQYGNLTKVVRDPSFYTQLSVPDTVMGRFELLSVVMILYFRRVRASSTGGNEIAQLVVDAFFQDIDHSMRELGIGDQGVPKRMKKFASMFYGRVQSYGEAMDAQNLGALVEALSRNIFSIQDEVRGDLNPLAQWMVAAEADLNAQGEDLVLSGNLNLLLPRDE